MSRFGMSMRLGCALVLLNAANCLAVKAQVQSVFPDLGLAAARLRFETGKVIDNLPQIFPGIPDIPGEASAWEVAQWNKHELLRPDDMRRNDPRYADRLLGVPLYTFDTADHELRLSIFVASNGTAVYELAAADGSLTPIGGSNLLLAAKVSRPDLTFDRVINYALDLKLSTAVIRASPSAVRSGAVLVQTLSGFTVLFVSPETNETISVFLQIDHGSSQASEGDYRGCYPDGNNQDIVFGYSAHGHYRMPFRPNPETPVHATYNLNDVLCQMLKAPIICRFADGTTKPLQFPAAARSFKNWRLTSMYVGLETENRDVRPGAATNSIQGEVQVALQIL